MPRQSIARVGLLTTLATLLLATEVPDPMSALADQLANLKKADSLDLTYAYPPNASVRRTFEYRVRFQSRGGHWRAQLGMRADQPEGMRVSALVTANDQWWMHYRTRTGTLDIRRRKPGFIGLSVEVDTPGHLAPLEFLGWKQESPIRSYRLDWATLQDPAWVKTRLAAVVSTVETGGKDGQDTILNIPVASDETDADGNVVMVMRGDLWRVVIRPVPEADGARLVTEERMVEIGKPPNPYSVFTYKLVASADGKTTVALPAAIKSMRADGTPNPEHPDQAVLVSAVVNGPIDESRFEIDPTIAKSIRDIDTGMEVEPEALGGK